MNIEDGTLLWHNGKFIGRLSAFPSTNQCGFYNCIAGRHHPTCVNYPGIKQLKELTFEDFQPSDLEPEFDDEEDW